MMTYMLTAAEDPITTAVVQDEVGIPDIRYALLSLPGSRDA